MLEALFGNIGAKIKTWAIYLFVFEALGAIIWGIFLMIEEGAVGLLLILLGPIAAWVSSWILYAFGELVEKTCLNEQNTREILTILQKKSAPKGNPCAEMPYTPYVASPATAPASAPAPTPEKAKEIISAKHTIDGEHWICGNCRRKNTLTRKDCWYCGANIADDNT
ncbi:MAG: hypothetical protein IJV88_00965 [Ruminococcus sp.]|nr:hypothetical protein [Ruminococcus sp.]